MRFAWVLAVFAAVAGAQVAKRDVDVAAPDGLKLKASWYPSARPGPGVLLLHQCNGDRKGWDVLATRLADAGISVLTFDLRGYGDSEGERFVPAPPEHKGAMTQHWPGDIDAAFDYLAGQAGVDKSRIGVGGASCGVNNAVETARRHPEVKSLVLLSGTTSEDGRAFLEAFDTRPVFVSASTGDDDALPYMQWLALFLHDPRSMLIACKDAGHGAEMFKVAKTLPNSIVDFFVRTLTETPRPGARRIAHISAATQFWATLTGPEGPARARAILSERLKNDPLAAPTLFPEVVMNLYGYDRLQHGDTKEAIEVLKLNELAYPSSANVYDSLGDAYLADGQKEEALRYSEKALAMLGTNPPDDPDRAKAIRLNSEDRIRKLRGTP